MSQAQNQTKGTRKIILDKERNARDVFEFNGFWAAAPSHVRFVYEEEPSGGLWQLILYDLERNQSWRVGSYIDGYENKRALYDMILASYYGGRYIDDSEEARKYDVTKNIIWKDGGVFVINLPDEWKTEVEIRIPALCGAGYPLAEPVYIGTVDNRYFALDCAGGIQYFNTLDELEAWVREQECPEGHEHPVIHWWEWHVTRGGEVVYSDYVQPSPQEVIDFLRRHLRPT